MRNTTTNGEVSPSDDYTYEAAAIPLQTYASVAQTNGLFSSQWYLSGVPFSRVSGDSLIFGVPETTVQMFERGLRPRHYCLPLLKREAHRAALVAAATSGNPKFFLGTDSAPHPRHAKESICGCAGIYTAHAAIELYAEVFEQAGALDRLEAFASFHGADFYRLPRNRDTLTLEKRSWTVPEEVRFGKETGVPLRAGETIAWRLVK